jgi:hypothetical protein
VDKLKSPRNLDKKNTFNEELGQNKDTDSDTNNESYTMEYGGEWRPMIASLDNKKALWDNTQVPGNKDGQTGNGAPWSGEGEAPTRNRDFSYYYDMQSDQMKRRTRKEEQDLSRTQLTNEINASIGGNKMKIDFKKLAEKSKTRLSKLYEIDDDYSSYGRYCGNKGCEGVWKELLGYEAKKNLGIEKNDQVWKCPNCGQITSASGSVSEQTSGFASMNNSANGEVVEDGLKPVKIEKDTDRTKR